jgi:hypothetical protein
MGRAYRNRREKRSTYLKEYTCYTGQIFMNKVILRDIGIIFSVFVLATLSLYSYYSMKGEMDIVYRNWDGPGYLLIAKTLYDPDLITIHNPFPFPPKYWALTYPLFPIIIRLFSFMGYSESMIFVNLLFSFSFIIAFYFLLRKTYPQSNPLVVSLLLIFYTPRWFIVSHVGSCEPLFLFLEVMFLYLFIRNKYFLSALCGAFAAVTRSNGLLLFFSLGIYSLYEIIAKKISLGNGIKRFIPYFLIPLFVVLHYTVYYFRFGDFFSYTSSMMEYYSFVWGHFLGMLTNLPSGQAEIMKEGFVLLFALDAIAIVLLFSKKLYFFAITGVLFFATMLTVTSGDISRYGLPLMPFIFLTFSQVLSKKPVYIALFLCIPFIYVFTVVFINYNVASALPY